MNKVIKKASFITGLLLFTGGFLSAQTLTVSLGDNNHAASFEDPSGSDIVMMQLNLSDQYYS